MLTIEQAIDKAAATFTSRDATSNEALADSPALQLVAVVYKIEVEDLLAPVREAIARRQNAK